MKTLVISYSRTGNNSALAKGLAEKIGSDYTELTESRKRSVMTILFDVLFSRIPTINPLEKPLHNYETVVFVAPIWFNKIATPFRALFKMHKDDLNQYAFISLSAGANGILPDVKSQLSTYLDKKPKALIHLLISELLPESQSSNRKMLNAYRINKDDAAALINRTAEMLKKQLQ